MSDYTGSSPSSLARRGFGVLHFDYLGLGDSAYAQVRDDAVANWVASVGHALDYLTLIGAESATAIGIRAGCLILNEYLTQSPTVNRVVYLDPYGTGRRYLREHTTLFRLSVGEDAATPGEVSIIGGRLSDHAAAEFAALRMGANPVSAHGVDNVLLVGRPAETDKRVTALASARELIRSLPAVCRNAPGRRMCCYRSLSPRSIRSSSGSTERFPLAPIAPYPNT